MCLDVGRACECVPPILRGYLWVRHGSWGHIQETGPLPDYHPSPATITGVPHEETEGWTLEGEDDEDWELLSFWLHSESRQIQFVPQSCSLVSQLFLRSSELRLNQFWFVGGLFLVNCGAVFQEWEHKPNHMKKILNTKDAGCKRMAVDLIGNSSSRLVWCLFMRSYLSLTAGESTHRWRLTFEL